MGSQSKRRKGTRDNRSITSDLKRETDQDANRTALQPTFEGLAYSPVGITQTDYVDVTDTIDPAQTNAPQAPAQITGLNVVPQAGSNTQLNLTWTVTATAISYNIYRSLSTGTEVLVDTSLTNSYADDNLLSGTTYFYKVSAVNGVGEGTLSAEDSATTTGSPPAISASILLHFDNNLTDSSGNGVSFSGSTIPAGYIAPGVFGTHAILLNTTGSPPNTYLRCLNGSDVNVEMNTVAGFSVSLWVYPTDLSALNERRIIIEHLKDANNKWTLQFDSTGKIFFFVKVGGTDLKREITGLVANSWQHIGASFNPAGNLVRLYRNAVEGINSTATTQYPTDINSSLNFSFRWNESLTHYYEGRIDEFQFYNGTVLSSTNITNLMNTNAP